MVTRPGAMHPNRAAVLAAVTHLWLADGRVTVRAVCARVVCARVGLSTSTVHYHLRHLADDGLVSYVPERAGTISPRFAIKAAG